MNADEQKQLDAAIAERNHWKAEHLKQQQGCDAALQKAKDQAAEHAKEVELLKANAASMVEDIKTRHASEQDNIVKRLRAEASVALEQAKQQHAADKAKLINEVLIPAHNDHQARLQADFAAKLKADQDKLLDQLK